MFIIGVTGSIGSGKSTIARILADMADISVVDADMVARQLVEPGKAALSSIAMSFGAQMLRPDGTLDRKKLGDLIFNDAVARTALNNIMFPLIRKRVIEDFNAYAKAGKKYLIYDAPLLFESGTNDLVDYTVLIYVPREVQIERVSDRTNLTWEEATARVNAQPPGEELLGKPIDYLIRNTTGFIGLNSIVAGLWKNIQTKSKA